MSLPVWPLRFALRSIPDWIHARVLSYGFNYLMKGQCFCSRLEYLNGKRLWLTLNDTSNSWRFQIENGRFYPDKIAAPPEVHIKGDLENFIQLATRSEDPDTLFFARQLSLEGNTEDGLYLKNMLDAMEFDTEVHFKAYVGKAIGHKLDELFKQFDIGSKVHRIAKGLGG